MLASRLTAGLLPVFLLSLYLLLSYIPSCVADVGTNCTTNENCTAQKERCDNSSNSCVCNTGYTNVTLVCKADLTSVCSVDADCHVMYSICSGTCQCKPGYTNVNGACLGNLTSVCSVDADCRVMYSICSGTCQCKPGYTNVNGACLGNLTSVCSVDADCRVMYSICSGTCQCKPGYTNVNGACLGNLTSVCSVDADCRVMYSICSGTCQCKPGYTNVNGACLGNLTSVCSVDADCRVMYSICSGTCQCKPGYTNVSGACLGNLTSVCSVDADCRVMYSICSGTCQCKPGYTNVSGACLGNLTSVCSVDADCRVMYSICSGTCQCKPGYTNVNGACLGNLTSVCSVDADCRVMYSICSGTCMCKPGYTNVNGACLGNLTSVCSVDADCRVMYSICSGTCQCKPGYTNVNGACLGNLTSVCSVDADCRVMYSICSGTCMCKPGYTNVNGACLGNLTSVCSVDADCRVKYSICSGTCQCKPGYTNINGACLGNLTSVCSVDADCRVMYSICSGTCQCKPGYTNVNGACLGNLTSVCSVDADCRVMYSICSGTCQCKPGYTNVNGACLGNLTSVCSVDADCRVMYSICSGTCQCKPGYTNVNGACLGNLNSICSADADCRVTNAACSGTGTLTCQCKSGYTNVNGACLDVSFLRVKNVTISEIGEVFLKLQWENPENVADVSKFEVTWQHGNEMLEMLAVSKNLSASLPSLISGATYNITITSYHNAEAKATYSLQQATKPSQPSHINYNRSDFDLVGGITIAWTYNGSTSGVGLLFLVELRDNATSQTVGGVHQSNTTSVNISSDGLKNGSWYSVYITAQSEEYNNGSVQLRERSGTYTETIKTKAKAPGPPSDLTCFKPFDVSIILTWKVPASPNGIIIQYIVETYNATGSQVRSENTSSTTFEVNGLHPGSGYSFKVFTHNEVTIETTGTSSGICYTNSQMSQLPRSLNALEITSRNFTVTWTKPADVYGELLGYVLRTARTEDDSCVVEELITCSSGCNLTLPSQVVVNCANGLNRTNSIEAIKLAGDQSYTVMTLNPDTTYRVTVEAVNQGSRGHPANISVTTKEEAPQKPYNVTVVNATSKEANVTWNINGPRPGKTTYTIRLIADSPAAQPNFTVFGFSNTTYELTGLEEDWHYSFSVEARTSNGSTISDPVSLSTRVGPADKVRNCEVRIGSGGDMYYTAKVSWNLPEILQRNGPIYSFYVQQEAVVNGTFTMIKDSNVPKVTDDNHTYIQDFQVQPDKLFRFNVSALNGFTGVPCSMNYSAPPVPVEKPVPVGALAGGIAGGGLAAIIVIAVIVFLLRRKSDKRKKARRLSCESAETKMEEINKIRKQRPINLATFAEYVADHHKDSNLKFSEEYDDLKTLSPQHPHEAADMEENRLKNRFVNILPFDHSRVRLLPIDDVPGSDYINANFLPGFTKTREYIACQGPIPATIDDHWRLTWEQNVRVIVMLTQYKEENRVKCEPYMPLDLKDPKQYGDLVVECLTYSSMNSFEYRTLKIKLGDKERTLKHFHFLSWRDYSANVQFDTMIDFIKKVRGFIQPPDLEGPMIVHCSAGVGRTGTYITIDNVIQHIDKYGTDSTVDIFNFVLKMRENRTTMVQTEQQYIFIHDCIKEYLDRFKTYENQAFSNEEENLYQNTETNQLYENYNHTQKTEL